METNIENNAAPVRKFTDTDRLNYLLQFIVVADVGDEEYCKGVVVNGERLEEEVGYGPMVNGRMEGNVKKWNDDLRNVIDRAMVAHGFANDKSQQRAENDVTITENATGALAAAPLFGVIEWISLQGGTFDAFNPGLITGKVRGLTYRYFITEGWIALRTPSRPAGKGIECLTVEDFQNALELHAPNVPAQSGGEKAKPKDKTDE